MASNSHRVAPRDAQTQAIRPDAVRLRMAKEVEVGRRGQRDRLLSAKRMRVQSPVPVEQSGTLHRASAVAGMKRHRSWPLVLDLS